MPRRRRPPGRRRRAWRRPDGAAGSSGQPMTGGEIGAASTGPRAERVDEAAASLAVRAREAALPAGHAGGADGRIGRRATPAGPGAAGGAPGSRRRPGARARQTVAPRSSIAWFHAQPAPGGTAASAARLRLAAAAATDRRGGRGRAPRSCRRTPTSSLEGERQHGPRRVRPDAGQREQRLAGRAGQRAAVLGHDGLGAAVQVDGAAVVAEPGPRLDDVADAARPRTRPASGTAPGTRGTSARPGRPASAGASARTRAPPTGRGCRRHGRSRRRSSNQASSAADETGAGDPFSAGGTRTRWSRRGGRTARAAGHEPAHLAGEVGLDVGGLRGDVAGGQDAVDERRRCRAAAR